MAYYNKNSFLKNARNMSFYTGLNYSNLPAVPSSSTDSKFLITQKYANRPDLLAHDKFGSWESRKGYSTWKLTEV